MLDVHVDARRLTLRRAAGWALRRCWVYMIGKLWPPVSGDASTSPLYPDTSRYLGALLMASA